MREEELRKEFERYGKVVSCDIKNGYGFVGFETEKEAADAMEGLKETEHDGRNWSIEYSRSKPTASERGVRKSEFRVVVENIPSRTSWQDLKDFARKLQGEVLYTNVTDRGNGRVGLIEYANAHDYEEALDKLDNTDLDGNIVRLYPETRNDAEQKSESKSGADADNDGQESPRQDGREY